MNTRFLIDSFGWGFLLWLIGYGLGILFFTMVPAELIGWFVTPIGVAVTLWVLLKKIKGGSLKYYVKLALVWTLLAIILDYLFIVKAFAPEDGYYKFDVYLYYFLTFALPVGVGWWKLRKVGE